MERQRDETKEETGEIQKRTVDDLRKELARLRELKRQKDLKEKSAVQESTIPAESKEIESEVPDVNKSEEIEDKLNEMDKLLVTQIEGIEQGTYEEQADYIKTQFQTLEEEIIGEKGIIEKELSPYEQLLNDYPWLESAKHEFMYSIPNKKKNPSDYESWKIEWAKVTFDYTKYAILHIIYLREIISEKPFSNFKNRQEAVKEIAEELINQELAKYISKKKEKIRVYFKSLEYWAHTLYEWALDSGKISPILVFEIRESEQKGLNNLPKDDLEEVFRILSKSDRGSIIKTDDGQLAFKIKLD